MTSSDGTAIAVETVGEGPPLVLTTGALQGRASVRLLAEALADRFTVHLWDRRGRGDSGGVPDSARDPLGPDGAALVAAEVADLEAVVAATGGAPAHYAHSAGGMLVLEAVLRGLPATRVVAHEPPWRVDGDDPGPRRDLGAATMAALRAGSPDDAAAAFLGGFPAAAPAPVERLRRTPFWAGTVALAPSLPHDVALVVGDPVPTERVAALDIPLLALDGDLSPAWVRAAVAALAASVPGAVHRTLPGQVHIVTPTVLAPVLTGFLAPDGGAPVRGAVGGGR
ncbi:alpha-beta hydrolase superfamily lysophospholipase [Actinomycetospora succinea]|uniref:Alpha-beta hydrolase superfamily lysophospholipase n=1 Tax=Actinomycetospora succinea TaxID=663603 RepID=A0A4R6UQ04_9PSEU|nr:alpha/beta hydrolase [Actinomycetospora succinea]TDQ47325.1 alpha-beta hydrolase superfamily lysophospholipase [Actinomycetospora succinea]